MDSTSPNYQRDWQNYEPFNQTLYDLECKRNKLESAYKKLNASYLHIQKREDYHHAPGIGVYMMREQVIGELVKVNGEINEINMRKK